MLPTFSAMKYLVTCLCWLATGLVMPGQNLIPNPGFETTSACPNGSGQLELAIPWKNPNLKSPDLYQVCAGASCETAPFVCVPENWVGSQSPNSGQGYAGILLGAGNENREYIQVPLQQTLVAGQAYVLTYYVSLGDDYQRAIDRIGVYFSSEPVMADVLLPYAPQLLSPAGIFFTDKSGWAAVTDTLIADGGEAFMTIGNFFDEKHTNFMEGQGGNRASAYYYFDDMSLVATDLSQQIIGNTRICPGDSTTLRALYGTKFAWVDQKNKAEILSEEAGIVVAPARTTTYEVSGDWPTATITVRVMDVPMVDLGNDTLLCEGENLLLAAGTTGETYLWQDHSAGPTFSVTGEGRFWVDVGNECGTSSDSIFVEYEACNCAVYFPNAFTPNGDGVNDAFHSFSDCLFQTYELVIFNRWGEQVFASKDPQKGWDGQDRSDTAPTGVYLYRLKYSSGTGKEEIVSGAFSLLR